LTGRCPPHFANGVQCLSTPKHNGKSGTGNETPSIEHRMANYVIRHLKWNTEWTIT